MKSRTQSSSKIEAKYLLTLEPIKLHDVSMSRAQDMFNRVRDALVVDAKRQRELGADMRKLSEAYNRYLALRREAEAHEESAKALKALLGPSAFTHAMESDESDAIGDELEVSPTVTELRNAAPMWQHVQQYLRFTSEAQVAEIVSFLDWVGIKTSRQAVEAAIKSHSQYFIVKKKGRESFVSLR
jgi:hypothetical protein